MTTTSLDLDLQLRQALTAGEAALLSLAARLALLAGPVSRRDRALCLNTVYELRSGPLTDQSRWADHPAVAALRWRLEQEWLDELDAVELPDRLTTATGADAVAGVSRGMRWLAAQDRLPAVYQWVAKTASLPEIVDFLSLEGGPDAGFDDLVAACQIGLTGASKMELAVNYWDEMGNGDLDGVHTLEHSRMAQALGIRNITSDAQLVEGLERTALCGMLAANHWLQPEMLGALGLIELQAGPRCRLVVQGLERTAAPAAAIPFYDIHAEVDPRHGRDWLEKAIVPLVEENPTWAPRILRGAWWRSQVNASFFARVTTRVGAAEPCSSVLASAA